MIYRIIIPQLNLTMDFTYESLQNQLPLPDYITMSGIKYNLESWIEHDIHFHRFEPNITGTFTN